MRKTFKFGRVIGLMLAMMGALVLIGWGLEIALLVQMRANHTGMVVNTAICFILLGLSLAMSHLAYARTVQTVCGASVAALGCAILLQHVLSLPAAMDLTAVHAWLKDGNPTPGRMAPNTALAFLCGGLATFLLPRVNSKARGVAAQCLTFVVLLLGLTGLVGYTLQLNLLYSWLSSSQMALHTATGLIAFVLGLWSDWRNEEWYSSRRFFRDDEKIGFVSAACLVVIALTAGIAGFAGQKSGLERALSDRLPSEFRSQSTIFNAAFEHSFAEANSIARRPNLLRLTAELGVRPDRPALRGELDRIGQSAITSGISGFRIVGPNNIELSRQGRFVESPAIAFKFKLPFTAALVWDGQFFMQTTLPLQDETGTIGWLHVEQPLDLITRQLTQKEGLGRTGEMGLCFADDANPERMRCFPQYRNPRIYQAAMLSADGTRTPMAYALEGKTGVFQGLDYRGKNVIAVHGPLTRDGLGLVIKQDTEELLAPIRDQILWTGPLLLVLVISGALLLRSQIAPLTSRLIVSERAASERELRIQTLVESVGEGIITIDADGIVETFNSAASSIFGYSPSEVIGQDITMLMPVELRAAHAHGMGRFLAGGEPAVVGKGRAQLQGLHKDGHIFQLELTVNAIETRQGRLFVGIVRDVTEQLLAQRNLQEAMEAAQKAANARSIFVANMSHELRTPMNAVLGIAALLARSPLTQKQQRDLAMISSAGHSLLAIINNILDFSKIEAGKVELSPVPFNLDDMLRNVGSIMSINAVDKNIELAIGVDQDVPHALIGDAHRLEQVLLNITANAIKFTAQGEVSVRVALASRDAAQAVLRFSVHDTGLGISEEQQSRLFSPFEQADSSTTRRFGGTGLGLTISKGLVELLGGTISLQSAQGEGSTFSFSVPMTVATAERTAEHRSGRLRVLLVDDNATSLQCLSDAIRSWQWEVDAVASGTEALLLLKAGVEAGLRYDVVLADWQMPGMDGLATTAAIRTLFNGAAMPIVLLVTAYGRERLVAEANSDIPDAMLTKPVTASSLFDTVQDVLAERGAAQAHEESSAAPALRLDAHILLVEDNLINQFVAKSFLEHAGATVEIAANGQEAIDRLAQPGRFDVILMDVQMPVMDGFTATRHIRSELKLSTPIIAMTAGVMAEEREQCTAAGMDAFVGKPIDDAQLLATIAALIKDGANA